MQGGICASVGFTKSLCDYSMCANGRSHLGPLSHACTSIIPNMIFKYFLDPYSSLVSYFQFGKKKDNLGMSEITNTQPGNIQEYHAASINSNQEIKIM